MEKIENFNMHKRIILVGKAACGKDYMRKQFEKRGFKYSVSYTTRPPRVGEILGYDYQFIDYSEAQMMVDQNLFYEHVTFNGWIYGTTKTQFYTDQIFIMTPTGISHIKLEDRINSFIIYLDIAEDVRIERLTSRHMPGDTLDRRIESDRLDFENFTDYDLRICNSDF